MKDHYCAWHSLLMGWPTPPLPILQFSLHSAAMVIFFDSLVMPPKNHSSKYIQCLQCFNPFLNLGDKVPTHLASLISHLFLVIPLTQSHRLFNPCYSTYFLQPQGLCTYRFLCLRHISADQLLLIARPDHHQVSPPQRGCP